MWFEPVHFKDIALLCVRGSALSSSCHSSDPNGGVNNSWYFSQIIVNLRGNFELAEFKLHINYDDHTNLPSVKMYNFNAPTLCL